MAQQKKPLHEFSAEQLKDLEEAFKMFDPKNQGYIDVAGLCEASKRMGMEVTEEQAEEMIQSVDKDGNGLIEFDEFQILMANVLTEEDDGITEELQGAFDIFDADGSGTISRDELRDMVVNLNPSMTDKAIDDLMKKCDANGDGEIDLQEFKKVVRELK